MTGRDTNIDAKMMNAYQRLPFSLGDPFINESVVIPSRRPHPARNAYTDSSRTLSVCVNELTNHKAPRQTAQEGCRSGNDIQTGIMFLNPMSTVGSKIEERSVLARLSAFALLYCSISSIWPSSSGSEACWRYLDRDRDVSCLTLEMRIFGIIRAKKGRRLGMQLHMTPMLISIMLKCIRQHRRERGGQWRKTRPPNEVFRIGFVLSDNINISHDCHDAGSAS